MYPSFWLFFNSKCTWARKYFKRGFNYFYFFLSFWSRWERQEVARWWEVQLCFSPTNTFLLGFPNRISFPNLLSQGRACCQIWGTTSTNPTASKRTLTVNQTLKVMDVKDHILLVSQVFMLALLSHAIPWVNTVPWAREDYSRHQEPQTSLWAIKCKCCTLQYLRPYCPKLSSGALNMWCSPPISQAPRAGQFSA